VDLADVVTAAEGYTEMALAESVVSVLWYQLVGRRKYK
jgi:hypothetical protein